MSKHNDGGPAFPEVRVRNGDNYNPPTKMYYPGMTLRDWFAGKALQGELSTQSPDGEGVWLDSGFSDLAERCYKLADAMLAEREKGR